ncbi:MAG: ferritin [Clostridia bacterium]|nr:ferritin [Clostridia bacterium]
MNNKTKALLNEQIAREFEAGYMYLDLAAKCDIKGLKGVAHWYRLQAEEEKEHAMIIYNYLLDEGKDVVLSSLHMPVHDVTELKDIFKEALQHELYITETINNIYDNAYDDCDYRTMHFLDWFVNEQEEEERNARANLELLELAGSCGCGMLRLDETMGERK